MPDTEPKDLIHQDPNKPELVTDASAAQELASQEDNIKTLQNAQSQREMELARGITPEQEENTQVVFLVAEKYPHAIAGGKVQFDKSGRPFIVTKTTDSRSILIFGQGGFSLVYLSSISFSDPDHNPGVGRNPDNIPDFYSQEKTLAGLLPAFAEVAANNPPAGDEDPRFYSAIIGKGNLNYLSNFGNRVEASMPRPGQTGHIHLDSVRQAFTKGTPVDAKRLLQLIEDLHENDPLPSNKKPELTPMEDLI